MLDRSSAAPVSPPLSPQPPVEPSSNPRATAVAARRMRRGYAFGYEREDQWEPSDNHPMLFELERVTIERDSKVVLQEVTASLPKGASCIAGPSGSGKSTVLRLLNRLADPVAGTVRYENGDVCERDPLELRREVCLVPQLPALLDGTVEENVRFAAELAGREPEVSRLLDLAGLDASFASRDAAKLSVGEQQRAMLARALAQHPQVLLLDEPTSALDEATRDAVERTLAELRREIDISIVLVSHDPEQARRLGDWVLRLEKGRLVQSGPVERVLA
jgi:putative ABC transport system ATP-binding protein